LNVDSARKKLFKKELCFKCKKLKHKACNCLESAQIHEIAANSKNDLLLSNKVVIESDMLISCFISMLDDSFDFKSFIVNVILSSLKKIFRSLALINIEVTDMTFIDDSCYKRIKTE